MEIWHNNYLCSRFFDATIVTVQSGHSYNGLQFRRYKVLFRIFLESTTPYRGPGQHSWPLGCGGTLLLIPVSADLNKPPIIMLKLYPWFGYILFYTRGIKPQVYNQGYSRNI